jgi:hypothetical protein
MAATDITITSYILSSFMRPAENPSTGCLVRSEGKDPYTGGLENVLTSL